MAEPVDWREDGVPRSARYDDIYHSASGARAQARHVFLEGCGLPDAWAGQACWRILETGFGLGVSFLTAWAAWRDDPQRPRMLHVVSVEAHPVSAVDLLRAAADEPAFRALAAELAAQWRGLLPGLHRLAFEGGRVLLTICIGDVQAMLRALHRLDADSIFLDGFNPTANPRMWAAETLKAVARHARIGSRVASWTVARPVRDDLAALGFDVRKVPGLPPKRDRLEARFAPAWTVRRRDAWPQPVVDRPGDCAVVGAGLAGAAVAASLALRGWSVTVLDMAAEPASGASGLPVGLLAPHVSPDDALLSRLTRAGVAATWLALERHLVHGVDWCASGVLERRHDTDLRLPEGWSAAGPNESWPATEERLRAAGLARDDDVGPWALWHARAGWVRPARLVRAWLAQPGVRFQGRAEVAAIGRDGERWRLSDAEGRTLAVADRVVVAAGHASRRFATGWPLQSVRGQLAYGRNAPAGARLPFPLNGDGQFVGGIPDGDGALWLAGATYERDSDDATTRCVAVDVNLAQLARLHPGVAAALAPAFAAGRVEAWAGIRGAAADRRPLVGPLTAQEPAGPWVCTAMGSRGLSFAALCAELLAARWHGEPLPLPLAQARALDTARLWKRGENSA